MLFPRGIPVPQRLVLPEKSKEAQPLRNRGTNGQYNAPGLPVMLGSFSLVWSNNWTFPSNGAAGCFYLSDVQPASAPPYNGSAGYNLASNVRIQASRSSSVYGSSSTVMPASADMNVGLYLGSHT